MTQALVYDAVRTPRGRGKADGALASVRPVDLGAQCLRALTKRNEFDSSAVEDVVLGCVTQTGDQGGCIAKSSVQLADWDDAVPATTLNRFCGSGLEAINQAACRVSSGHFQLLVAGGIESMSRTKMGSDGGPWLTDPEVMAKTSQVPQGISADLIATLHGHTREDVDGWAVRSQSLAEAAQQEDRFANSLVPVVGPNGIPYLDHDEYPRPGTGIDNLAKLNPAFEKLGKEFGFDNIALQKYPQLERINHIHHAGNSSGIVDGAAAVLIGNREVGKAHGLKPRAKIVSMGLVATEPTIMLTGPAPATKKALSAAKMKISDIDLIEVNEAFASVVLLFLKETKANPDKVNVNGGAIALGHPLGATGAMLMGTLLDELERRDKSTGLVTLCIGGGMGIATIVERV